MSRFQSWLFAFPTTTFRILVSSLVYLGTSVAVLVFQRTPPEPFYWFVLLWAGIDVAQFGLKRFTYRKEPPSDGSEDQGLPPA